MATSSELQENTFKPGSLWRPGHDADGKRAWGCFYLDHGSDMDRDRVGMNGLPECYWAAGEVGMAVGKRTLSNWGWLRIKAGLRNPG